MQMAVIDSTGSENVASFRWTYIVLPASILLVSFVLAAVFYPRLPEEVAYHFSNGLPDRWLGRTAFTTWTVVAQAALALGSFVLVRLVLLGAHYWSVESAPLQTLLPIMGNMVALPQVIILFAMLHVFLYNSYQIKLMSLLAFALIVLALGGAVLGVVLFRATRQARRLYK
jgi:uncharacterized membrane protein